MIIGTIFSIIPAFVYWLAAALAMNGDPSAPTAGDIVAFTTLQSRLFFPLGQLLNVQVEIAGSLALFDRIFEYLDLDPEIVDAPDAVTLEPAAVRGRVRLHRVWFRYPTATVPSRAGARGDRAAGTTHATRSDARTRRWPTPSSSRSPRRRSRPACPRAPGRVARPRGVPEPAGGPPLPRLRRGREPGRRPPLRPTPAAFALEEIDFEAEPGQLVALVGPSGSGKTTTTYLVPRLYDVDSGAVEIDGVDVRRIALASLGRTIGVVTQETYLFHASIRDNLLYARPEATEAELEAAARAAAIHERVLELPDGLRDDRRRARLQALGRREAADRDRPGPPQGPPDPHPRRGHVRARHGLRAAHPGRPRAPDGGPHDDRDRPPPLDDPAGRPDPRLRARPDRGARPPRGAPRRRTACTPASTTSSSRRRSRAGPAARRAEQRARPPGEPRARSEDAPAPLRRRGPLRRTRAAPPTSAAATAVHLRKRAILGVDWRRVPGTPARSPRSTPRSRHPWPSRPPSSATRAASASSPGPGPASRSRWTTRPAAPRPARPRCSRRPSAAARRWTSSASSRRSARQVTPLRPPRRGRRSATPTRTPSGGSTITHEVEGPAVDVEAVRRAIELSATRYCSVSTGLASGIAELHHRYVVISPEGAPPVEGEAVVTGPGQELPPDGA